MVLGMSITVVVVGSSSMRVVTSVLTILARTIIRDVTRNDDMNCTAAERISVGIPNLDLYRNYPQVTIIGCFAVA